jgi:uncharacterized membrane protein
MVVRDQTALERKTRRARPGPRATTLPPPSGRAGQRPVTRGEAALAQGLGWFSVGLGLVELLAPRQVARFLGLRDERPLLLRALGARELASGLAIFTRRRPAAALWSRVVGDVIDLSLLGRALADPCNAHDRLAGAVAAVMGVTALDVAAATTLTRAAPRVRALRIVKSIAINRTPAECYAAWRRLEHLPRFMSQLEVVRVFDGRRSHWVARGPAGTTVEWDAEIVRDEPDALIAWRSLGGGDVDTRGSVVFAQRSGGHGTIVRVAMEYAPPAGRLGALVARLFVVAPEQQVKEDLRRFKRLLETGEVPTTEGQPSCRRSLGYRAITQLGGES